MAESEQQEGSGLDLQPGTPRSGGLVFGHSIDAIVLAGTHQNPSRLIGGQNKAFLEIAGVPLVRHVVNALIGAEQIDQIFVVGPKDSLDVALQGAKDVHSVQQEGKMLSNSWAAIRAAEARQGDLSDEQISNRPLLMISCDLPLISPQSIDDFVGRAALIDGKGSEPAAMMVGVAEDEGMKPYYGGSQEGAMRRPPVELNEGMMRLANIYVARPRQLAHSEFLQTSFSYRKAKDWRNVMRLVFSLFSQHGGWKAAWFTCRLQLASMLSRKKGKLFHRIKAGNTVARVEHLVSTVLGGSVKLVVTPYGSLSLDVDDERDYTVLSENFTEWMKVVEALDKQTGQPLDQEQR